MAFPTGHLRGSRPGPPSSRSRWHFVLWLVLFLAFLPATRPVSAELQFDVFVGYDQVVREASWFPVAVEIFNDGASFNGIIELSAGNITADQVRRIPIELPTNTRKRLVIPVFAAGGRFLSWNARLVDQRGKLMADRLNIQPKTLAWEGILMGAMPRTFAGAPSLPETKRNRPEIEPQVARMPVEQFPDNPIALEGLDALYLNSEKALAMNVNQVSALLAWIHGGGHLIVGTEQLGDINSTPWLQQLLPSELSDVVNVTVDQELQEWLRRENRSDATARRPPAVRNVGRPQTGGANPYATLGLDQAFIQAQLPVATGKLRDGQIVLAVQNTPLIIEANRGRGRVTLLTFSPEREPFRSWKNRGWFWAKIMKMSPEWFVSQDFVTYGGLSVDGVFGALIDTDQVRKLPVEWLLLLLVVYLIVIGPFDQYWLKKINRQMLTWITFPTYVVLFSLLIYFIGYKLRAGETEWNELHVVDVLPRGPGRAELRGRTFASIYSSANARYQLAFNPASSDVADQTFATLRGELLDLFGGAKEGSRASLEQTGNMFKGEIFVPVWTSLLYVNDWMQPESAPLMATVQENATGGTQVVVENLLDRPLTDARIVVREMVYELGALPAQEKKTFNLNPAQGVMLSTFVQQHGSLFQSAVEQRRNPLGDSKRGLLDKPSLYSMVASFASHIGVQQHQRSFVSPPGFDLSDLAARGDAILMAWDADHSFTKPINQFQPPRHKRSTLLRLAIPVGRGSVL